MITASYSELFSQSPGTINDFMMYIVIGIDKQFGNGFAEKNPDLVGTLVTAAVQDFINSAQIVRSQEIDGEIYGAISRICESIDNLTA